MQKLARRELLRGGGAAIGAAALTLVASEALAAKGIPTTTEVRAFARKLLTESSKLTVCQCIERKRIAIVLQVMIGDDPRALEGMGT